MPDCDKSIDIPVFISEQETSSTQQEPSIEPAAAETEIQADQHSSISAAQNAENEAANSDTESTHSDESYYGEIHIQPPPPGPKLEVYRDPDFLGTAPSLEVPAHILRPKTRTTILESLRSGSNKDIIPGSNIALNDQENWARSLQSNFLIYAEEKKHRQTQSQIGWGSIPPQKSLASRNKDKENRRKALVLRPDNPAFDQENRPVGLGRRRSVHAKMPRQPLGLRKGKKRVPLGEIKLQVSVPPVPYPSDMRESRRVSVRHDPASLGYMRSTIAAEGKRREKTPGKNRRVD
ncbi:hypothetical protein EX30DRAFT_340862 [Ascodesmis nigricans]|uniref:Uncharacterized protein n=1 Tax=Ascodesmis nigricans TaxID=341454 RepID=A0A4S2MX55_9PEZI|nr:hypothetical protein EX30DRAFT_340862 [Ascodesmis nigricans]